VQAVGRSSRAVFASRLLRPEPEPGPTGVVAPAFRPIARGHVGLSRAIHAEPRQSALIGDTAAIFRPLSRGHGMLTRAIQATRATRASQPVSGAVGASASGGVAFTGVRVAVASVEVDGSASAWFLVLINGVLMSDIGGDDVVPSVPAAAEQNYVF
jgi:hypothetical protein